MTDPKLSLITMEMVTLTINMMEDGKHFHKLLQLLLHRTQNTQMNYHLMLDLELESAMIDPRLSHITMEMVTLMINTMVDGKLLSKKRLPHLLLLKTQSTLMNFHSMPDPELELDTIDHKLSAITTEMVMLMINMTEDGKHFRKPLLLQLHRTQSTPTSFHSTQDQELE